MKKLTIALATTAIAAGTASMFASDAEAGRGHRGGGLRFHMHHMHMLHMQRQHAYRDEDDDYRYVQRRKAAKAAAAAKAARAAAAAEARQEAAARQRAARVAQASVARFADGKGRMFDTVSKVWFDGKGQCWMGEEGFGFKSGSWFYGDARWIESSAGWGVTSGTAPEQVSCQGIKAFSGKVQEAEAKPVKAEPVKSEAVKKVAEVETRKVEQAEVVSEPVAKPAKAATTVATDNTPAKSGECKKYFPSVGELVSVPCGE